jgi:hypothetical protein
MAKNLRFKIHYNHYFANIRYNGGWLVFKSKEHQDYLMNLITVERLYTAGKKKAKNGEKSVKSSIGHGRQETE